MLNIYVFILFKFTFSIIKKKLLFKMKFFSTCVGLVRVCLPFYVFDALLCIDVFACDKIFISTIKFNELKTFRAKWK